MVDQARINQALLQVGPKYLRTDYQRKWTPEKPTTGYCYLISEILYHYFYPTSKSYCMNLGIQGTHWFVAVGPEIIDLTSSQFDKKLNYGRARHCSFFKGSIKTERGFISKKAYQLATETKLI